MLAAPIAATAAPQETFATPQAAVDALKAALKADSDTAMIAIFGEKHKDLIRPSRPITRRPVATRAKALAGMQAFLRIARTQCGPACTGDR